MGCRAESMGGVAAISSSSGLIPRLESVFCLGIVRSMRAYSEEVAHPKGETTRDTVSLSIKESDERRCQRSFASRSRAGVSLASRRTSWKNTEVGNVKAESLVASKRNIRVEFDRTSCSLAASYRATFPPQHQLDHPTSPSQHQHFSTDAQFYQQAQVIPDTTLFQQTHILQDEHRQCALFQTSKWPMLLPR